MAIVTTSYAVDFKTHQLDRICKETLSVYRRAVIWLLEPVQVYSDELSTVTSLNKKQRIIECHTHRTKRNVPAYDFDSSFPNMPSYVRRAAINDAIGAVASYNSNHTNWVNKGKKGKEPTLGTSRFSNPSLFRGNMYKQEMDCNEAKVKLFNGKTWDWYTVSLKKTDMEYLRRHWYRKEKISAPTLEKHYGRYRLRFACTASYELSSKEEVSHTICAVDLGINNDAVCSVMTNDGTVSARKFINFADDKGRIWHGLNKIKQFQKRHGSHDAGSLWRHVQSLNDQHAYKIARAIADFAIENNCDCIVFEYLETSGKKKGSRKQKLAMWRKNTIQRVCESIAHRAGIRISHICAWQTSKLAYDGSGTVERSIDGNYSICRFKSGKVYNCDLSASYNIGARYFIRAYQKTMNESSWSHVVAKVPDAVKRTKCTLSTLWSLQAVIA